jgi:hypothetical protein
VLLDVLAGSWTIWTALESEGVFQRILAQVLVLLVEEEIRIFS